MTERTKVTPPVDTRIYINRARQARVESRTYVKIQADELEFGDLDDIKTAGAPGGASIGSLDQMEKDHIIKVLKETGGNKKKAAEILGIERRTLYNKAKRLGIDFGTI